MILCKGDQVPSLSDSLVTQYSHLHHDPVDNKSVLRDVTLWRQMVIIFFLEDN